VGDKQGHPFRGNQYTDAKISNDVTAAYSGQVNGTLRAQDADGRTLAYLDWVQYGDRVSISMVETAPEARRQGLARKLVERLLDENPGARLEWGMTTPEGTALRAKMESANPRLREQSERERLDREHTQRELLKDRAEYDKLRDETNPAYMKYVAARMNEIDERWGGDIDRPEDLPKSKAPVDYPKAGAVVDGREVIVDSVQNTESISASLTDYEVRPGIREVPMSSIAVTAPHDLYYSSDDLRRVNELADRIKDSKKISPLIVVNDREGTYVLEGVHRLGALHVLGAKAFPALVVDDLDPETGVVNIEES